MFHYPVRESFYHQLVPSNRIDISFSGSAYHWLNTESEKFKRNAKLISGKTIFLNDAICEQLQEDWQTILNHRYNELKKGGLLVMVLVCNNEDEKYTWRDSVGKAYKALPLSVRENLIVPVVLRNEEEYMEPIKNGNQFKIIGTETVFIPFSVPENECASKTMHVTKAVIDNFVEKAVNHLEVEERKKCKELFYEEMEKDMQVHVKELSQARFKYLYVIAEKI